MEQNAHLKEFIIKTTNCDKQRVSEESSIEVQSLKISENLLEPTGRTTWYAKHEKEETENTDESQSSGTLDYICGNKQQVKSPLKASAHLNGSTPQLSIASSTPSPVKSKSRTPPASPQESPRFVKFREKSTPSIAFQRRAEKAASVYGDKLQTNQKKQRPRSSIFGASAIMRRPRNSLPNSSGLTLLNILDNKKTKAAFLEFLESEYSSENLCFWLSCEKYRKLKSEDQRMREGQYIYSQYVSPNAANQVNIDHLMRRQITMAIMAEDALPLDIFDSAKRYVFSIMENDSFPRFLTSSFYKDSLSGKKSPFDSVISNILPGGWNSTPKSQNKLALKNSNNNNSKIDLVDEKRKSEMKTSRRFSLGLKKSSTAPPKGSRASDPEISTGRFYKVDVKIS